MPIAHWINATGFDVNYVKGKVTPTETPLLGIYEMIYVSVSNEERVN